jgi:hypothetical protein
MDNTTIYLIISAVCGVMLGLGKILYNSKCYRINICWGGCVIDRDIESEYKEDEMRIEHNNDSN